MPKRIEPMERRDIIQRLRLKQSIRGIKKETGIDRITIRKIRDKAIEKGWLTAKKLPGEKEIAKCFDPAHYEKCHPLDPIKDKIKKWVEKEYTYLTITRLVNKYSFNYSEITIRRYIKSQFPKKAKAIIRRLFAPGEYAEVDFGYLGLMYDEYEKRNRKVWLFCMRLNYSRRVYRELVFSQKAPVFFQCHIHAFEYFGGVPQKVVCDNLKAAVIKACTHDPLVNRAYRMLAEYYNFLISPCLPRKPEHKGGVEKDVDYVKRNFIPLFKEGQLDLGHSTPKYRDCVKELKTWTTNVDDHHKIQYTGSSPLELFEEEAPLLQPVAFERWDIVTWKKCSVGNDWRIQLNKAFYSVPYRYIGEKVMACSNSTEVIIFYDYEQISRHLRAGKEWERVINPEHGPPNYEEYLGATSRGVKNWAWMIGTGTTTFVEGLLQQKGVDGLRPARAVCGLEKKYSRNRLENACKRALYYKLKGYQAIKDILIKGLDLVPVEQWPDGPKQEQLYLFKEETFRFARDKSYFES